jgi:trehalose/maltose transport system substrate-binding protein
VEQDGQVSIDNPRAVQAFERAKDWLALITPESVLSFSEEESLQLFASGNAAFLRHWPGAWAELTAPGTGLAGKVGIAPLPRGDDDRHPATLGGWQLAVSRHSRHPELAVDLLRYLTGATEQRRRALQAALLPTLTAVYQEAEMHDAVPVSRLLADGRIKLVPRPSNITAQRYPEVTETIQQWSHEILSGVHEDDADVLRGFAEELNNLRQPGGRW